MKFRNIKIPIIASILFLISSTIYAEDENVSVEPSYVIFKSIEAGQQSDPLSIILKNTGSTTMDIGTLSLKGFGSSDFALSSDGCSGGNLAADTNCTIEAKLTPQQNGSIKNAWVDIPYTVSGGTEKHLSVFMTSKEDVPHEVKRRLQPTIYSLDIADPMDANSTYDLNWTVVGYHDGYKIKMVMFDCTGEVAGECGDSYSDASKFYETTFLSSASSEVSGWHYRGEDAYKYSFDNSFTVPEFREDGSQWDPSGTPIVIRFYIVSDYNENAVKPSISLIIPGSLPNTEYYDASGRKIQKYICPVDGCNE